MRKIKTLSAASVGLLLSSAAAGALSVSLEQTTPDPIDVGDSLSFELSTSSDFPEFVGFSSSLTFDAGALEFTGADISDVFDTTFAPDPPVDPMGQTTVEPITAGNITGDLPSGATDLVELNFEALAGGETTIGVEGFEDFFLNADNEVVFNGEVFADVLIGGDDGDIGGDGDMDMGGGDDGDMGNGDGGTPPPAVIPVPASALLLLSGMGGLASFRLRRRR